MPLVIEPMVPEETVDPTESDACPLRLDPRDTRKRVHLILPIYELEEAKRIQRLTKARSFAAVVRYAIQVLTILVDSREAKEKGWYLCWVKDGKARKIPIPWS